MTDIKKRRIKLTAADDKIAFIFSLYYKKIGFWKLKRAEITAPNPQTVDSFLVTKFEA